MPRTSAGSQRVAKRIGWEGPSQADLIYLELAVLVEKGELPRGSAG